jgi:hypothetical protein
MPQDRGAARAGPAVALARLTRLTRLTRVAVAAAPMLDAPPTTLRFPATPAGRRPAPAAGRPRSPTCSGPGEPLRALIVDDEPRLRQLLVRVLARDGFECRDAADGAEGLAVLAEWPAPLVLSDLSMPGVDGRGVPRARPRPLPRHGGGDRDGGGRRGGWPCAA